MRQTKINGFELAYEITGDGEPVLLVHGALIADALAPLSSHPSLEPFQLIRYHRRGMGESGRRSNDRATNIAEQVGDALGLLEHLGVAGAHVVGHSGGGAIALELAARHPDRVRSLALLEPALLTESAPDFMAWLAPVVELYEAGDADAAVKGFLAGVGPADALAVIEHTVPGAIQQAVRDADAFFEGDLPAAAAWSFGADDAALIRCPVLSVLGAESVGLWLEGRRLLHSWFRECQDADIAGAGHLLQLAQPEAVADALAAFLKGL